MHPLAAITISADIWGHSLSVSGMEMTTPLPVPTQRRLPAMSRAVMRTKEKPSLPVPGGKGEVGQCCLLRPPCLTRLTPAQPYPASC